MLASLSITSFRGIDSLTLSLGMRTYIRWENGSGKTHVLDAIHILAGSRPLYGEATLELGSQFEGIFLESDLAKSYRIVRDSTREFLVIQGSKITKPKYMQALPWRTVHISPFDMNLLYFAPSMRRDYMDLILSRTHEQFAHAKRDYELTMRQRNALLKKIRDGYSKKEDLDFWDHKFSEYAHLYGLYRSRYRDFVRDSLARFPAFFTKYPIEFYYESTWIDEEDSQEFIRKYLLDNRERDILTWHTHIWPHRDDWGFRIHGEIEDILVASYLSRGEMKMLLLGLKMIEVEYITLALDLPVILLVDDIFAELDEVNSDIFLNSLMQYQIILTSQKPLPNHEKDHNFICINLSNA